MADLTQYFPGGFDHNTVKPDEGRDFTLIDDGTLLDFEVTGAEVKDASTGSGCYLVLESTSIGPTHVGRKIWKNITLLNASEKAQQIGQAQLSALCHAVNIPPPLRDTDLLFGKIFRGRVGIEKGGPKDKSNPAGERYADKNTIVAFERLGTPSAAPAVNKAAAPAAPAKAAPWAKK